MFQSISTQWITLVRAGGTTPKGQAEGLTRRQAMSGMLGGCLAAVGFGFGERVESAEDISTQRQYYTGWSQHSEGSCYFCVYHYRKTNSQWFFSPSTSCIFRRVRNISTTTIRASTSM